MAAALTQSLQIMSWNVNGVKTKTDKIIKHLEQLDKDIYFIQETHLSETEALKHLSVKNYETHHGPYSSSRCGVAILLKEGSPFTFISNETDPNGRYLIIRGRYGGRALTLVNIYGPSGDDHESKTFFENIFVKIKDSTNIIMGGDFNLVMDPEMDSANKTNRQTKPRSLNVVQMCMETCDLCDIWRQKNSERREYTYRKKDPLGDVSRIDYFLISNSLWEHVPDCEILQIEMSDHSPVLLKLWGSDVVLTKLREGGKTKQKESQELREVQSQLAGLNLQSAGKQMNVERKQTTREQTNAPITEEPPAAQRFPARGPAQEETRQCYNCQHFGHIAKNCPERNHNYRNNRGRGWRGQGYMSHQY